MCIRDSYYSELLRGNMPELTDENFLYPHLNICDEKGLAAELGKALSKRFGRISAREMRAAVKKGMADYQAYMAGVRQKGEEALLWARAQDVYKRQVLPLPLTPEMICIMGTTPFIFDGLCPGAFFHYTTFSRR